MVSVDFHDRYMLVICQRPSLARPISYMYLFDIVRIISGHIYAHGITRMKQMSIRYIVRNPDTSPTTHILDKIPRSIISINQSMILIE